MKRLILFLLVLSFKLVTAQTTDSLKQQLEKYKSLYEQGLINETEYSQLKQGVLKLNVPPVNQTDKKVIDYCRKSKGQFIASGIMAGATVGFLVGGFRNRYYNRQLFKLLVGSGGVTGGLTLIFISIGTINKSKCIGNGEVSAQIGLSNISLTYRF